MTTSEVIYTGNLRTTSTHLKSGSIISTDAPTDNNGKGELFSPTDLIATALASCMQTLMGITANNHSFDFDYCKASVTKTMASNPRRISEIEIHLELKNAFTDRQKSLLEAAALNCPVAKSIHPDIKLTTTFTYQ